VTATAAPPGALPQAPPGRPSRRRRSGLPASPFIVVPAVATAAITALPLAYLAAQAFSEGAAEVVDELWQRRTLDLAARSLALAAVVTAASLVVGIGGAFLVTRTDVPGRRAWRVALALPLSLPSYVTAFAWVSWRPSLAGFWGAALVLSSVSYPFVYLPVAAALRRLDATQEEVARSLGRSPTQVAVGLTLRQIRPAASAGALLVALYVLSDFGAVATMRFESFTWVIYGAYRAGFDPTRAAVLSLVLVALSLVLVRAESSVRGRGQAARTGGGAGRRPAPLRLGRARWPAATALAAVVGIALAAPIALIVRLLLQGRSTSIDTGALLTALGNTVGLAAVATAVSVALAIPVGVLAARVRSRWAQGVERTTFVAHALPGIVIGISVVYVGIRLARPFYQEAPLLILAYVVLFCSLAVGSVRASVEQASVRMDEVARSLGARPLGVLWRVNLPLAAPGIAAGAGLVFLAVMKELPATLLLRPTGTETLATGLWRSTSVSAYSSGAPYALLLVLVAAVPAALLTLGRDEVAAS
jgi:iron(III) transport system permease protein